MNIRYIAQTIGLCIKSEVYSLEFKNQLAHVTIFTGLLWVSSEFEELYYNFLRHIAVKKVLTYSKQGHTQSQYFSDVAEHNKGYGKMKEKSPNEVTLVRL